MIKFPFFIAVGATGLLFLTACATSSTVTPETQTSGKASDGQACQMWIQSYKDFIFAYTAAEKTAEEFQRDPSKFSYVDETGTTVSGEFDPFEQAKVSYLSLSTTLKEEAGPLIQDNELASAFNAFIDEYTKSFEDYSLDELASNNLESACKNLGVDTFEVQKAKREAR